MRSQIVQSSFPSTAPAEATPRELAHSILGTCGIEGVDPKLAVKILFDGLPLSPPGEPVRRASSADIWTSLRSGNALTASDKANLGRQLELLLEHGILVEKRNGDEPRFSLTIHPDRVKSSELRQLVDIVAAERARRAESLRPKPAEIVKINPAPATSQPEPERKEKDDRRRTERALIREIDYCTGNVVAGVSYLRGEGDRLLAALHIGERVVRGEGKIFSGEEEKELSVAQMKIVDGWITQFQARQNGRFRQAGQMVLILDETNGKCERTFISIEALQEWRTAAILPLERRARNEAGQILRHLDDFIDAVQRASANKVLPEELAARVEAASSAFEDDLACAGGAKDPAGVIRRICAYDNAHSVPLLQAVDAVRRAVNLPSIAEQEWTAIESASAAEKTRRRDIFRTAAELETHLHAWTAAYGEVVESAAALHRAFVSRVRPADSREAVYWDELEMAGTEAVAVKRGKHPLLTTALQFGKVVIGGEIPLPNAVLKENARDQKYVATLQGLVAGAGGHPDASLACFERLTELFIADQAGSPETRMLGKMSSAAADQFGVADLKMDLNDVNGSKLRLQRAVGVLLRVAEQAKTFYREK